MGNQEIEPMWWLYWLAPVLICGLLGHIKEKHQTLWEKLSTMSGCLYPLGIIVGVVVLIGVLGPLIAGITLFAFFLLCVFTNKH
jgi:hypothetical protein